MEFLRFSSPKITKLRPPPILEYFWNNSTPCLPLQVIHINVEIEVQGTYNTNNNNKKMKLKEQYARFKTPRILSVRLNRCKRMKRGNLCSKDYQNEIASIFQRF